LILGSLGVEFKAPIYANTVSSANVVAVSTEKVEEKGNSKTGSRRGDDWPDRRASFRAQITKHAVKIQENIVLKDIQGNEHVVKSSGSGAVINVDKKRNKSLILTAWHVCLKADPGRVVFGGKGIVDRSTQEVITLDGDHYPARVVYQDPASDSCVMEADGIAGKPAELGDKTPPPGARIYTAGAPAGIWDVGVTNIEEGIMAGVRKSGVCVKIDYVRCYKGFLQFSIPSVGGMSGSAVYYKGKIIGLVTAGSTRYEHVTWGPGPAALGVTVEKAREIWKEQAEKEEVDN
jgi:S1-C subfamily serine protease